MIIDKELLLKRKKEIENNLKYVRDDEIRYEAQIELIDSLIEGSDDDILSEVINND